MLRILAEDVSEIRHFGRFQRGRMSVGQRAERKGWGSFEIGLQVSSITQAYFKLGYTNVLECM